MAIPGPQKPAGLYLDRTSGLHGVILVRVSWRRQCVSRPNPYGQRPGKQNGSERIRAYGAGYGGARSQERRIFSIDRLRHDGRHYSRVHSGITFQYDKNSDGNCNSDDENIEFAFAGTNVTRTTRNPATTAIFTQSTLTDGNATAAYVYLLSATDFSYGASALLHFRRAGWLQRHYFSIYNTVQKITVSLTVAPKSTDSNFTGSPVTMSLTADLRNHGF